MWSLEVSLVVFAAAAIAIGAAGTRLVGAVDELADRTRLGEAFFGVTLLGGLTSLSGSVLSVTAAIDEAPQLAVGNAIGGIAVQTVFLVVADAVYRRANLEHAAPSLPNLLSAATLVLLLGLVVAAATGPDWTVVSVHPVSVAIVAGYLVCVRLVQQSRAHPRGDTCSFIPVPRRSTIFPVFGHYGFYPRDEEEFEAYRGSVIAAEYLAYRRDEADEDAPEIPASGPRGDAPPPPRFQVAEVLPWTGDDDDPAEDVA